jgi:hypothetical protein
LHRSRIDEVGSISISEDILIQAMRKSFDEESLREELERLLGNAWEEALEPFRGVEFEEAVALRAI